jgi:ubiquinone/menaquinone biosynthesis C-methylase UbiE
MHDNWRSFYQNEAEVYHEKRYHSWYGRVFVKIYHRTIEDIIPMLSDKKILDIASGTGHNLPVLSRGNALIVASDLTIEMLKDSRKRFGEISHPNYVVNNAFELPFPDHSFDIVTSARFLHLFSKNEQQKLISEMARVVKPDGVLIIDFYNKYHWIALYPFIVVYRLIKRRRPANDTRNTINQVKKWLPSYNLGNVNIVGVGSYLLLLSRWLGEKNTIRMGNVFKQGLLAHLSDHFVVAAKKER